jgi:hypothetical protein
VESLASNPVTWLVMALIAFVSTESPDGDVSRDVREAECGSVLHLNMVLNHVAQRWACRPRQEKVLAWSGRCDGPGFAQDMGVKRDEDEEFLGSIKRGFRHWKVINHRKLLRLQQHCLTLQSHRQSSG